MRYVLDTSSFRTDKTSFFTPEEAEERAGEASRILNRPINVYELEAGELLFTFRVMPDGSVEKENPLSDQEAGGAEIDSEVPVLGSAELLDVVAEIMEAEGKIELAAVVDAQRAQITQPLPTSEKSGVDVTADSLLNFAQSRG